MNGERREVTPFFEVVRWHNTGFHVNHLQTVIVTVRDPRDEAVGRVLELKAAAQGIDDAGMQEANPDLHMRRVAEELFSILEMVG